MARLGWLLVCAALTVLATATCTQAGNAAAGTKRTLVLCDSAAVKDTHSDYFAFLAGQGFELTYMAADSSNIALFKYGEALYENLIIFAPTTESFGGVIGNKGVTDFIDDGGNVLIAGNANVGSAVAAVAREVGFEMDEPGNTVIDYVHNVNGDATVVVADRVIGVSVMVGDKPGPIAYRGQGMQRDTNNPLPLDVLSASSSAFTHDPSKPVTEFPSAVGKSTVLVGATQARNNARATVSGSIDLFSNEFFALPGFHNREFAQLLTLWTFQQRGVLRARDPRHHLVSQTNGSYEYTINDEVQYSIIIEQQIDGKWVPYQGKDVQLEFVRIDPFVRKALALDSAGRLHLTFRLPDVYGVFQFRVDYKRSGYSYLYSSEQVSVRPYRHTQYERFILSAYPYYASSFSMMCGLFIFSFVFLYYREKEKLN